MPTKAKQRPKAKPRNDIAAFWGGAGRPDGWAYDGAKMLVDLGLQADPWQVDLLQGHFRNALLNCSRQSGKTTTTAVLALHEAMFCPKDDPAKDILLFAPTGRQSDELLRKINGFYRRLDKPVARESDHVSVLDFENGARILPLPNNEEAIRGYSPRLVIIDEAARVPDALYKAIRPMLAATKGRLIALSTPFGKQGWFYDEWIGTGPWKRVRVTASECPRIDATFLEDERRALGETWYRQEYECSFEMMAGLVYPEFESCLIDPAPLDTLRIQRYFAGTDFGFHNPSAVIFAGQDFDDTLWVFDEVYGSRMTDDDLILKVRAKERDHGLKTKIEGYWCDSEAAGSIEKFRRADLPARKAIKKIDLGIRAVSARVRTGRLKVFRTCGNLVREAGLYRYHTEEEQKVPTDNPVKEHDHAMDALRYLVAGVDRPRDTTQPITWRPKTEDEDKQQPERLSPLRQADWEKREERAHRDDFGWEDWR